MSVPERDDRTQQSSLVAVVQHWAAAAPDRAIFHFLQDGRTIADVLTCRLLDQRARSIAATLQEHTRVGDRVLLAYPPGLEFVSALFGCFSAGVIAVPCPFTRLEGIKGSDSPLGALVHDCEPAVLLTGGAHAEVALAGCRAIPTLAERAAIVTDQIPIGEADQFRSPVIDRHTVAFLQYTSGSTGAPKGVTATHGNLLSNLLAMEAAFFRGASVGVTWLPLYHDMGLIGTVLHFAYAAKPLYLMSPLSMLKHPIRWLEAISQYRADISAAPNFAYDYCVQRVFDDQKTGLDLSGWKVACNGAEPVRANTLERFAAAFAPCGFRAESFYPCYGLAEATLFVSGGDVPAPPVMRTFRMSSEPSRTAPAPVAVNEDSPRARGASRIRQADACDDATPTQTLVGCGRAWTDHEIRIVDPHSRRQCAAGNVGEIWVRGPSVSPGYWNRDDENEETFGGLIAGSGQGPFLRTGDLGFVDAGELFVCGRIKDLIIIRGQNHSPQDIEETVNMCHPALRTRIGAAFTCFIDGEERLIIAQEVDRRAGEFALDELRDLVRAAVSDRHQLQAHDVLLVRSGTLPKTTSGKIRRGECRRRYLTNQLVHESTAPS